MKKIIFTVTNDLTYDQRMHRICHVLAEEGYIVVLVGRLRSFSKPLKNLSYSQVRLRCFFNKGKLFYLEYNIRLFFYLLFKKFDIVCAIDLDTILPAFIISRIKKKIMVYDAHEYFTEVIEVVRRPFVKKIWQWVEGWVVPRIRYAYTVSESLKNIFEEKYKTPFALIRNVPLLAENNEQETKPEKYLIYIGAVNEGRGLEESIEAMKYIDATLYVCGDGDIYQEMVQRVHDMGLDAKVRFFGYVEPEELKKLTNQATIGLLLLKNSGLSYYYSLANKFFDYIHAGIPQITIDFPEYRLINEKFQVAELVELNVPQIVQAAERLLNDSVHYRRLVKNTEAARQEYNWQKESRRLINFYNSLEHA